MNNSTPRLPKLLAGAAFAVLLALGGQSAWAQTFLHEGIVYKASGNKLETPKLTGKLKIENGTEPAKYEGDIVIPDEIVYNGKTYIVVDLKNAFKGQPITSFVMPNTVTKISIGGFQDCTELKSINLSTGLTKLEQNTFANCTSLESITVPGTLPKLDSNEFKGCTGLKKITIENGETPFTFEAGAFTNDAFNGVEEVYIYRQLNTPSAMDRKPLRAAKALKKVVIGGSMTSLYDSFCEGASLLESVTFESDVTALGTASFANTAISEITLPASLTTIPSNCFSGTANLKKVQLGDAVTSIEAMAFRNSAVSEINLPATITTFGDMAFQKAKLAGKLELPEATKRIGDQTFAANAITEVSLPAGLATIGNGTFMGNPIGRFILAEGNENFKSEYLGYYITSADSKTILAYAPEAPLKEFQNPTANNLAPYAFYGAKNLESFDMPAVWNYGDYSLSGTGVKKLEVKGAVGRYVAADCPELTELTVEGREVPFGVAKGCAKLEKVTFQQDITVLKSYAFEGCTALKSINLGSLLAIIEAGAFNNCGIENITVSAAVPASLPEGVFTEEHANVTATVPVSLVDTYKAADGWKAIKIAGDANLAVGSTDMGMPAGLYYAGEDGMLHCAYADGNSSTYDVGGVPHTFQLVQFSNRIYGASAGKKFIYSNTGSVDGDGKLFYISQVGGRIFQAVVIDNAGGNAYKDPFGLYIYGETLYVNDRNVCIRKIPASALSLPDSYPSWMENNWMAFYGAEWVYGCIKAGFAITEATNADGSKEPLYWVGMKYNGNGIFRFRESNIGTGADQDTKGSRPAEAPLLKQFDPIITTFAIDSKHGHLYIYVDRMGKTPATHVLGGLYRLNLADLEANPDATDFNSYNPVLIDGAPVMWEGGGANEHVGIPQLSLDEKGEYLYWCHRAPSDYDVEVVNSSEGDQRFYGGKYNGKDAYHYAWAETYDANNPRHQDGIKRIKLGDAVPEVEIVVPGVRGYGVIAVNYEGSKVPTNIDSVTEIATPEANIVSVSAGAITACEAASIDIFNAAGLLVARVQLAAGQSYDFSALEAGVYIGTASSVSGNQAFKFAK